MARQESKIIFPGDLPRPLIELVTDKSNKGLSYDEMNFFLVLSLSLSESNWKFLKDLRAIHTDLDYLIRATTALREVNTKGAVLDYIWSELVAEKDKYSMISKIAMPGAGIRNLYERVSAMNTFKIPNSRIHEIVSALHSAWDDAIVDIVCDKSSFFTKTKTGNTGTLSEFVGTMVLADTTLGESPNLIAGKYRDRFLSALDYKGIIEGKYTVDDENPFWYQQTVLQFLYDGQGPNKLAPSFWKGIEANPDFIFFSHDVAVKEGYENANELLLRALSYTWDKLEIDEDRESDYEWQASNAIESHFDGQTAADKLLSNPTMHFEEVFRSSRYEVTSDGLSDYLHVSPASKDIMVLLNVVRIGTAVRARFAIAGETYREESVSLDTLSETVTGFEGDYARAALTLVKNFEEFHRIYLQKLAEKN